MDTRTTTTTIELKPASSDMILFSPDGFASIHPQFQSLLTAIVSRLDSLAIFLWSRPISPRRAKKQRRFMHSTLSQIPYSCEDYLIQIIILGDFDKNTLIYSFILLEKFIAYSKLRGGKINFLKLIAISFFVAFKVINDNDSWHLKQFEDVCDFDQDTMRDLEIAFLKTIKFRAFVSQSEFCYFEKTLLEGLSL